MAKLQVRRRLYDIIFFVLFILILTALYSAGIIVAALLGSVTGLFHTNNCLLFICYQRQKKGMETFVTKKVSIVLAPNYGT